MVACAALVSPYNLGLTFARNMSLSSLNLAHKHILMLTDAEEMAIEKGTEPEYIPFPWEDVPGALRGGVINGVLDIVVLSTRGTLDAMARDTLPVWLSYKMRKDLRKSARRKLKYVFWERAIRVTKTALFSEATLFVAEWIVSSMLDCYRVFRKKKRSSKKIMVHMGVRIGIQFGRCCTLWMAVAVGNGVGSGFPKLQPLFMLACTNVASFVINMYYSSLSARIEDQLGFLRDDDHGDDGRPPSDVLDSPPTPPAPAPQQAQARASTSRGPRLPPRRLRHGGAVPSEPGTPQQTTGGEPRATDPPTPSTPPTDG